ncbi:MAG: amidohydrolase [Steroidobacteraceae bacterium]
MNLRVTLVQQPLHWEDPAANLAAFERLLAPLAGQTDLVVLPEMFTTGFSMQPQRLAEPADGSGARWLTGQAQRLGAAVSGSIMTRAGGHCVNRLWFATPDGALHHYDKRHLFRMAGEHEAYAAGDRGLVVEWRGWRIAPLVCYDLRFPVWSRRRPGYDYDLLLYVANWPARRRYAWSQLLIARAIENQACVVGVNRVGADGAGVPHAGDSAAHDHLGAPLAVLGDDAGLRTVELDREALSQFRERFPAHLDADRFELL